VASMFDFRKYHPGGVITTPKRRQWSGMPYAGASR
jgi:hypothetical protein